MFSSSAGEKLGLRLCVEVGGLSETYLDKLLNAVLRELFILFTCLLSRLLFNFLHQSV